MKNIFTLIIITALVTVFIGCYEPEVSRPFRVYYEKGSSKSGSVPVDTNIYNPGEKAVVLGKGTLENEDYTFLGWMFNTRIYQPGDEVTGSGDIYLVAAWDDVVDTSFEFEIRDDEAIITAYNGSNGINLIIPFAFSDKPVTEIENNVFRNKNLRSVNLSKNLKRIGSFTFSDCGINITTLTIPDSVVSIGTGAFQNNSIMNINFGSGLTSISKGAFSGNKLLSVRLPDNIILIDDGAFFGNKIEQIFISADVEIGNDTSLGTNGASFKEFYEDGGKQAGEYNYTAGTWVLI